MLKRTTVGQQPITIGNNIALSVLGVKNGRVQIGIDAPGNVRVIARSESCQKQIQPASPPQARSDPG